MDESTDGRMDGSMYEWISGWTMDGRMIDG